MLGGYTSNEQYYRRMISSIGVTMLALWILLNGIGMLLPSAEALVSVMVSSDVWVDIINQLLYGLLYFLAFTIPVFVLKAMIGRRGDVYYETKTDLRLSAYLPAIVLGGIFLIFVQSTLNAALVSIFQYASFSEEVIWGTETIVGYGVVLRFIVMALIPAFCEEFLFRGAILTNLLPFGRTNAILISSLLFAIMHQNAEQVLYAFAAGVLLGVVYERTGSIWNCVFLHLMNNFSSIVMSILPQKLHRDAEIGTTMASLLLFLVCGGCVVLLIRFLSPPRKQFVQGIFNKSFPATDSYAACKLASGRCVSLFFSFPMVLFFLLSASQMITLIWMAVVFQYA